MGASVVYTEFVSSDGIIRENIKTLDMVKFEDIERPIGVQIFGNDPSIVSQAAFSICNKFGVTLLGGWLRFAIKKLFLFILHPHTQSNSKT